MIPIGPSERHCRASQHLHPQVNRRLWWREPSGFYPIRSCCCSPVGPTKASGWEDDLLNWLLSGECRPHNPPYFNGGALNSSFWGIYSPGPIPHRTYRREATLQPCPNTVGGGDDRVLLFGQSGDEAAVCPLVFSATVCERVDGLCCEVVRACVFECEWMA